MADLDAKVLASLSTPDQVETRLAKLEFRDGVPLGETVEKAYDFLDFTHALNVFLNGFRGASAAALRKGYRELGAADNEVVIFSEMMDSQSLFLTANMDTVYYLSAVDLASGPMVVETPPASLALFDDLWFQWVIDFGLSGPDRGEGGRFLLVPPSYDGPLPDSGFHVAHVHTTSVLLLARSFLVDNDPAPTVETIKRTLKIYPFAPGGFGTSIATLLDGEGGGQPPHAAAPIPETKFVEASGKAFNTIPPTDLGFFELLNELVQEQPAGSNPDIELMGQLASIGIVKGKAFKPDKRMHEILENAAAVGNAISRSVVFDPRVSEGWHFYGEDSHWVTPMWEGGYNFETPIPMVTEDGIKPFPATGVRTVNARTAFFYQATGCTPAMCMRLVGAGSQYVFIMKDADGNPFDGAKTYRLTLPPKIPAARLWSLTVYDNETRSMLQTPQRFPRAGSQSYPTAAAKASADGSTTITFGPEQPADSPDGNWIQTTAGKGWFTYLRIYSPLPTFFDKTWRPSEIEVVDG